MSDSAKRDPSMPCLIKLGIPLPLRPIHPPPHTIIHILDTSLTSLDLEPLPMLPPTSLALPLDLLLREFEMHQSLHSFHKRDFAHHIALPSMVVL